MFIHLSKCKTCCLKVQALVLSFSLQLCKKDISMLVGWLWFNQSQWLARFQIQKHNSARFCCCCFLLFCCFCFVLLLLLFFWGVFGVFLKNSSEEIDLKDLHDNNFHSALFFHTTYQVNDIDKIWNGVCCQINKTEEKKYIDKISNSPCCQILISIKWKWKLFSLKVLSSPVQIFFDCNMDMVRTIMLSCVT